MGATLGLAIFFILLGGAFWVLFTLFGFLPYWMFLDAKSKMGKKDVVLEDEE